MLRDGLVLLLFGVGILAGLGVIAAAVLVKPGAAVKLGWTPERLAAAAAFIFVLGTFTWRTRTATELSETPVDAAGFIRLAADCLALALALFSLMSGRPKGGTGGIPVLVWLFGTYVGVAAIGSLLAVEPFEVLFRAFDLGVCLLAGLALVRAHTFDQIITFWRRILLFLTCLIVGSALAVPSLGFPEARGGLVPFRLEGVFPTFSANSVGLVGTMLVVIALGHWPARKWLLALGLALVLLSQYRTGYIAVAVVVALFLALRGSGLVRLVSVVAVLPLAFVIGQSAVLEEAWSRGEVASQSAATLSGRTVFWSEALDVAQRSPILGLGLTSGTRNEVLAERLGRPDISTIHSTWVEAYVGTGLVGVSALILFVWMATRYAWRIRAASVVPILMLTAIGVRSVTGTTIELASIPALLVITLGLASEAVARRRPLVAASGSEAEEVVHDLRPSGARPGDGGWRGSHRAEPHLRR